MRRRLFIVFILIATLAVAGCKISGTITLADGTGVGGVTVYLDGEGEDGDASIKAITDADGNYVFEGFHHGTLTITPDPESEEFTFDPTSETLTVELFANAVVNFKADVKEKEPTPQEPLQPWSTYQGNAAHTGYVPVSLNQSDFNEGWTRDLIGSAALNPGATGDGKVFVTTIGYFGPNVAMALDSDTGDELWTYHFGNIHSIQPPGYANNTVYIQSTNHQDDSFIWAFDAESGDLIFKTDYENQWDRYYAPTIYDNNVYIGGGYYSGAYAFNGVSGEELWYTDWGNQYMQWTPAVNEEHVIAYTGLYDPQLTVINRLTGKVKFSIPDPNFVWEDGV